MDRVELGTTGIEVSRLCFGTGTHGWNGSSDQTDVGLQAFADLLIYGFEQGITFWDSADQYGSHPHVAQALQTIDRKQVVITSKTCARSAKEAEQDIDRYLQEMKTDYIDIVLMHCMTNSNWPTAQADVMNVLAKKKEQGIIRSHGVSCHDFGAFQQAAITNWVDVVLARINYAGKNMDGPPEKVIPVIEQMHANDMGIYGMKVMGCGDLGHDAQNAIHFVLDLPSIDAITIGMKNKQEIDDNIGYVEAHDTTLQPV